MKSIQFVSSIISISWVIDWIGLIEGADCPAHQLPFQSQQQLQSILQSRWWIKQILADRLSSVKVDNVFEFDDDFKWTIITGMFQLNVVETVYGQVKCVTQACVYAKHPADDASFSLPIIRENNHRILERSSAVTNRRRFLTPRFNRPFAAQKTNHSATNLRKMERTALIFHYKPVGFFFSRWCTGRSKNATTLMWPHFERRRLRVFETGVISQRSNAVTVHLKKSMNK